LSFAHRGFEVADILHDLFGALEKHTPLLGEGHPARRAIEESNRKPILECTDLFADSRWRYAQARGGFREACRAADLDQRLKFGESVDWDSRDSN
jgi:hypothetical protein